MNFIPSCDDREDAIRSLSEIFKVSSRDIERVLQAPEILEIAQDCHQINTLGFHFVVSHILKASPRQEITHACYYHSTSYDGDASWFDEGLLGTEGGAGRFLEKIAEWIPAMMLETARHSVRRIVETRSGYEGATAESTGPYAWNTFTAASSSYSGIRYRVPEAIRDLWSPSGPEEGGLVDLEGIIKDKLKPVVIKFKGKISDLDDYCAVLWAYLLSDNGDCHLTHTFIGNGEAICREDIVAIIDIIE